MNEQCYLVTMRVFVDDDVQHRFEQRALIVKHAFTREGYLVDDDAVRAVAALVETDSIRELEYAVLRVALYETLTGQPISPEIVETVLANRYASVT